MEYSKLCEGLPYREEQVHSLAERMMDVGYDKHFPIVLWSEEGGPLKLLDGRHRYEAAKEAGVEPATTVFVGTKKEAAGYVKATNIDRRHLTNDEKFDWLHSIRNDLTVSVAEEAALVGWAEVTVKKNRAASKLIDSTPEAVAAIEAGATPSEVRRDLTPQGSRKVKGDVMGSTKTIVRLVWSAYEDFDDAAMIRGLAAELNDDEMGEKRERIRQFAGVLNKLIKDVNFDKVERPNLRLIN